MKVELLLEHIRALGVETLTGVPDSTLKELCDYLGTEDHCFDYYTVPNEGSAVGMATGAYLSTGKPACVYMQNSGIGNALNPITSIAHAEVYDIPMLFVVGYRGYPGMIDEPQHKFMGRITERIFECLEIEYAVIDGITSPSELKELFRGIAERLNNNKQFALIVKKDTFDKRKSGKYLNDSVLVREDVIAKIIENLRSGDLIVSTTGKISREVYEQSNHILGQHNQSFLTVGGMGHASMIAFGIAKSRPDKRVICLDGDGAILMHMGSLAFLANQDSSNLVHICLNNDAHESVGGMPTAAAGLRYAEMARACGYPAVFEAQTEEELDHVMDKLQDSKDLAFIEIKISNSSREELGRPKESPSENANNFMDNLR